VFARKWTDIGVRFVQSNFLVLIGSSLVAFLVPLMYILWTNMRSRHHIHDEDEEEEEEEKVEEENSDKETEEEEKKAEEKNKAQKKKGKKGKTN